MRPNINNCRSILMVRKFYAYLVWDIDQFPRSEKFVSYQIEAILWVAWITSSSIEVCSAKAIFLVGQLERRESEKDIKSFQKEKNSLQGSKFTASKYIIGQFAKWATLLHLLFSFYLFFSTFCIPTWPINFEIHEFWMKKVGNSVSKWPFSWLAIISGFIYCFE